MRLASPLVISVTIGVLGCTHADSQHESSGIVVPAANESTTRTNDDPRIGKWISQEERPLRTVLTLKANGMFSMGDFSNGREFPDGLTGTWTAEKDDLLCLRVEESQNCKIGPGDEMRLPLTLRKDGREMVAIEGKEELIFVRADAVLRDQ